MENRQEIEERDESTQGAESASGRPAVLEGGFMIRRILRSAFWMALLRVLLSL